MNCGKIVQVSKEMDYIQSGMKNQTHLGEGDFKKEGYKQEFLDFDKQLSEFLPFQDNFKSFHKPGKNFFAKRDKQYRILMDKQLFLARLENEVGKGTSWSESEDDWD